MLFGAGLGIKKPKSTVTAGSTTVFKSTSLFFTEQSVRNRKARVQRSRGIWSQPLNCRQGMLWWYSSATSLPHRPHKHFPEMTNTSNIYGPVMLEAWKDLPSMPVGQKKAWWGKRRVACGGKTIAASISAAGDDYEDEGGDDDDDDGGEGEGAGGEAC